ncbi:MAG: DNA polymerase Y family protein [Alphaproteobacteria bacterium]|nr:MAG: DNA polymerase Y family protein [Alphaproteobacteria bacterium]
MPARRILSLWFPRLAVERILRREGAQDMPMAVVREVGNLRLLTALSPAAEAAGLRRGQPLRDALALCPGLVTRPADPVAEAAFLNAVCRWASRFSPWVAEDAPDGLLLDITGCAHLFGGEEAMLTRIIDECAALGLSALGGIADTVGAAWALAHHTGGRPTSWRTGDAIAADARATRARAARRHWTRGGPPPLRAELPAGDGSGRIAPPGRIRAAIGHLPLAALRLPADTVTALARLGLRRIADIDGLPRATLARRFGQDTLRRLDQALGLEPEPIAARRTSPRFAVRLSLPDPIGLRADIEAGLDRLLPALAERLAAAGRGARQILFQAFRSDGTRADITIGLARPTADPARIRPLVLLRLDGLDAGFGIDVLRLEATVTEPVHATQLGGHRVATERGKARLTGDPGLDDLVSRIGTRIGLEAVTRLHPAESHIPEKSCHQLAAAWSEPAPSWPWPAAPRPAVLFRPEAVDAPPSRTPPRRFRWRRRTFETASATGPERIAPEWWLDDPDWRSGTRDYWRVETTTGERLWLFRAHGGETSGGWFCQGDFG